MTLPANATAREGHTGSDGQRRIFCEMDERDRFSKARIVRPIIVTEAIADGTRVRVEADSIAGVG